MFKNTITINYRKEYSFLIYMFINETIEGSEYNEQKNDSNNKRKSCKMRKRKDFKNNKKINRIGEMYFIIKTGTFYTI